MVRPIHPGPAPRRSTSMFAPPFLVSDFINYGLLKFLRMHPMGTLVVSHSCVIRASSRGSLFGLRAGHYSVVVHDVLMFWPAVRCVAALGRPQHGRGLKGLVGVAVLIFQP